MFGNMCKTAFEAIIFVFVMHPFDVGDRCVVDGVQVTFKHYDLHLRYLVIGLLQTMKYGLLQNEIYYLFADHAGDCRRNEYIDHCFLEI